MITGLTFGAVVVAVTSWMLHLRGLLVPFFSGWSVLLAPLQAILTPFVRVAVIAVCVVIGLAFFKHHYVVLGTKAEAARQETADAKIAAAAHAAVHNSAARRVLDPYTDLSGQ
jgi:hypothetical protein